MPEKKLALIATFTLGLAFDIGENGVLVVDLRQINQGDVPPCPIRSRT